MTSRHTVPVRPARSKGKHEDRRPANNNDESGRRGRRSPPQYEDSYVGEPVHRSRSSPTQYDSVNPARPAHSSQYDSTDSATRRGTPFQSYQHDGYLPDRNKLTKRFMEATGTLDEALACDVLAGTKWNYEEAVTAYKRLQCDDDSTPQPSPVSSPVSETNVWHKSPPSIVSSTASVTKPAGRDDSGTSLADTQRRRFVRGLSKVYGLDEMQMDKTNLLYANEGSAQNKLHNINISLDNTYMIPDLSVLPDDLANYIEQELIDFVTMNILEKTGHINWWAQQALSRRLWPLHTTGDGNCLLHAASLGMWGVQDRALPLRNKLDSFLKHENPSGALYRRWRWQQTQSNMEMGLVLTEEEWQKEWDGLLSLSSHAKKLYDNDLGADVVDSYYEFLEEFHVYVMAQIVKRPIIVFADTVLKDVDGFPLSPIPFGGIYLPLECSPDECHKTPLMLAYDRCHFTAVVTMAASKSKKERNPIRDVIPLTGPECDLLPMHFFVDPGADVDWNNLPEDRCTMMDVITSVQNYLDVRNIPLDQIQAQEGSVSKSSSSSSLNGKESEKGKTANRVKKMFSNSKSSGKVRDVKNSTSSEIELEPGKELIMCAKLTVNTPKSYQKDIDKYITITRKEFEEKKVRGILPDPKTLPGIATKDYALLSIKTNQSMRSKSPTTLSPASDSVCRKCELYQGTPEQDFLCSTCYRQSDNSQQQSEMCRKCGEFAGTKEHHYYCSRCYNEIVSLEGVGAEQSNNSNIGADNDRLAEYAINMTDDNADEYIAEQSRRRTYETNNNRRDYPAFPQHPPHSVHIPIHHHQHAGSVHGNPGLLADYDRYPPNGHLQREDTRRTEPFLYHGNGTAPTMSLGLEPPSSRHGLHMVESRRDERRHAPATSRYDEGYSQRGLQRQVSAGQRPRSQQAMQQSVGGGTNQCKNRRCGKFLPLDHNGLCRFCRVLPQFPQLRAVRSVHLAYCMRHGCRNEAASNLGLCRHCLQNEQRPRNTQNSNSKYSLY